MAGFGRNSGAGWIALARATRDHPLVGFHLFAKPCDPNKGALQPALAFIDLLMECRYEAGTVMNGGWKMTIERGQLVGAVSWLANRWNWTPKAVRGWLDRLEADGMISRFVPSAPNEGKAHGNASTVISICNYDKYQLRARTQGHSESQSKGEARAKQGQQYKDNKGTKGQESPLPPKGNADLIEMFEAFWKTFPGDAPPHGRKTDKPKAFKAFRKIVGNTHRNRVHATGEEILAGARRYAATNPDHEFIPMPTTWLNGARWLDQVGVARPPIEAWWKNPEQILAMTDAQWRDLIAAHANGTWPPDKLGPAPGKPTCVVPQHLVNELHLEDKYDHNGFERKSHG